MLWAKPLLAQTNTPISAIDWLSQPGLSPLSEDNLIESDPPIGAVINEVTVIELDTPVDKIYGLIPAKISGIQQNFWTDLDPNTTQQIIRSLSKPGLPATDDLLLRALLAESLGGDVILGVRAKALIERGAVYAAYNLLGQSQVNNLENSEVNDLKSTDKKNYREKLGNTYGLKRYRIQEVVKPGQVVLIQVIKDERGQKGAALSTFISIAGKYIVLMPNTPKGGGISRKIFNPADRKKIRTILNEIEIPKEMGLIVRTAGSNKTKNEIEGIITKGIGKDFDWQYLEEFLVEGKPLNLQDSTMSREIIISEHTANRLNLKIGDTFTIYYIKKGSQAPRKFKLAGIYRTGLAEYDKLIAIIDIRQIQNLRGWSEDEVGGFEVFLDNIDDLEPLTEHIYLDILKVLNYPGACHYHAIRLWLF